MTKSEAYAWARDEIVMLEDAIQNFDPSIVDPEFLVENHDEKTSALPRLQRKLEGLRL